MEMLASFDIASVTGTVIQILYVALGLGLVIFFHELGHFAVAKWCNVNVERFSIGFGPILWRWKKGETEYALSAIPFGGYVKMLGQDDMDPSQLSSEEIAQDPRSYSAKPVSQRMAIISAGVIMNVVTGLLFFAIAFRMSVEASPSIVGTIQVGMPAWTAGLERGDRITRINDREVKTFSDIMRGVALSQGPIRVKGVRPDGRKFNELITPKAKNRRIIGVLPTLGLTLINPKDKQISPTFSGSPASKARPAFLPGDTVRRLTILDDDDAEVTIEVTTVSQLQDLLADPKNRKRALDFWVQRDGKPKDQLVKITVAAVPFRTLGLWMDIGKIVAVKKGSPADVNGLKVDDRIIEVDGKVVGDKLNPLQLPDYLAKQHGKEIVIKVNRHEQGADSKEVEIQLVPGSDPGWVERPVGPDVPLSVPAAGFAFHLIPKVLKIDPGSPADLANIEEGEIIKQMKLTLPEDAEPDGYASREITIDLDKDENNWAYAFWMMQELPTREVSLSINKGKVREDVVLKEPLVSLDNKWFVPSSRGIRFAPLPITLKADNFGKAISMGMTHTQNTLIDIYMTLNALFGGRLSPKELHGPIGIAQVAYQVAGSGLADLLLFLGFLSVNLAVLNFLPIPILDGGHMVFLSWELVTRKRPSERVLVAATYFGLAFVVGLMCMVIYLDIFVHWLGKN